MHTIDSVARDIREWVQSVWPHLDPRSLDHLEIRAKTLIGELVAPPAREERPNCHVCRADYGWTGPGCRPPRVAPASAPEKCATCGRMKSGDKRPLSRGLPCPDCDVVTCGGSGTTWVQVGDDRVRVQCTGCSSCTPASANEGGRGVRDVTLVACLHCTRGLESSWAFCPWCGWAQAPRPHADPAPAPRCDGSGIYGDTSKGEPSIKCDRCGLALNTIRERCKRDACQGRK